VTTPAEDVPSRIDTTKAHPARVYNYFLGGKDNFAADRAVAEAMLAQMPTAPAMARANRAFLHRAVRHLVADRGVTQFLDVGSGIPTMCNVHEVAQSLEPTSRVVYVDRDEVVAAHSRALLVSAPEGRTAFITADATDPRRILGDPVLAETLDLTRPVALMMISFLMYFDDEAAHRIVRTLVDALPAGSYVTVSHPTADFDGPASQEASAAGKAASLTYLPRSRDQVAELFTGLELCEPGVVPMLAWRPDETDISGQDVTSVYYWVAMGRKA
jgi:O-methyltransferase involved in polyketide biosynthesis